MPLLDSWRTYRRLPERTRRALVRIAPLMAALSVAGPLLGVRRLAGLAGLRIAGATPEHPQQATPLSAAEEDWVVAAEIAARRWPAKNRCLRYSLLVGRGLRRHSPRLHLGVATSGSPRFHAWVEAAGRRFDVAPHGEHVALRPAERRAHEPAEKPADRPRDARE